jgi:hypothetical protein
MTINKKVDRLESGPNNPKSPNDEVIWVDTNNNSIKRYNETNESWVSVGGQGGAADTGDITFDGIQIIGDGTMELVPDSSLNSDQYLIIDPTAPNHVHIRAGGAIDASTADIIIGGENTNLLVSDTGDYVDISQLGGGQISFSYSGVSLRSAGNQYKTRVQYSSVTLVKIASNEWLLTGDTVA